MNNNIPKTQQKKEKKIKGMVDVWMIDQVLGVKNQETNTGGCLPRRNLFWIPKPNPMQSTNVEGLALPLLQDFVGPYT